VALTPEAAFENPPEYIPKDWLLLNPGLPVPDMAEETQNEVPCPGVPAAIEPHG
jgi:hypothetical protein